jgi:hypothetical protein
MEFLTLLLVYNFITVSGGMDTQNKLAAVGGQLDLLWFFHYKLL